MPLFSVNLIHLLPLPALTDSTRPFLFNTSRWVATRRHRKGWESMQLAKEVKTFSSGCEHILSAIAQNRPLTPDEAAMIEYYCVEILAKIAPILRKPTEHLRASEAVE